MEQILKMILAGDIVREPRSRVLRQIASGRLYSIYFEIRAFLLLGSLAFVSGAGIYIYNNFDTMGRQMLKLAILIATTASIFFVVRFGPAFSRQKSPSTGLVYDANVFLAGLLGGICIGYAEYRYAIYPGGERTATFLIMLWNLFLAYRYDHRGALGLAISAGLSFVGLDFSHANPFETLWKRALIPVGLGSSTCLAMIAYFAQRSTLRAHFAEAYMHSAILLGGGFMVAAMGRYHKVYLLYDAGLFLWGMIAWWAAKNFESTMFRAIGFVYLYAAASIGFVTVFQSAFIAALYFIISAFCLLIWIFKRKGKA